MAFELKIKFTDTLRDGTLSNYYANGNAEGYQFDIRLAYYRGHFLSTIDELEVTMDERKVLRKDILFCINGKEFILDDLKNQSNEFWNILAPATIKVRQIGGLEAGEHKISLKLMLRSPYLPLPGSEKSHTYAPINSCDEKIMKLQ